MSAENPSEDRDPAPWVRFVPWAVLLCALAAFVPALGQGFVSWDDDRNFALNERWRGLTDENREWMFGESHIGHWQPLTWVSLALDWELAGGDVPPGTQDLDALAPVARQIHRTSLLIHGLSAVLVFALIRSLLRATDLGARAPPERLAVVSGAGALLFAIHPLRVESVAWATERRDVLAGVFLFAALLAWLRAARRESVDRGAYWLCFVLFALSLLAKAWAITLPAVLLVLDIWPLRRWTRVGGGRGSGALVVEKVPFALLSVGVAAIALRAQAAGADGASAVMGLEDHSIAQRLAQAAYGAVFYVRKTLWPTDLGPLYELEVEFDPTRARYVASAVAFVVISLVALVVRTRWPAVPTAWLTFLIVVSPVLGLVQSGAQIAADRYTYLACVPFAALAAGALLRAGGSRLERPLLGLAAVVLVALGAATWRQTRVWRGSQALWEHVARVEPGSYIAHFNLAAELLREGRADDAIASLRRSIEAHPGEGNVNARMTLGGLLLQRGRRAEAETLYAEGLAVDPQTWYLIQQLEQLWGAGAFERVDRLWRDAVAADPDDWGVHYEYGKFLARHGRTDGAVACWRTAAEVGGDLEGLETLWAQIGNGELTLGRNQAAEQALRQALDLARRKGLWLRDAELDLAECLRRLGRAAEARAIAQRVLQNDPRNARAQQLAR